MCGERGRWPALTFVCDEQIRLPPPQTMNVVLGPFVADVCGLDGALDLIPYTIPGFAVSSPADVLVEITVRLRRQEEWARGWWKGPRVDLQTGLIELRKTDWSTLFDLRRRRVQAVLDEPRNTYFESLLRTVLQIFALHDRSGLVLHASAVEVDDGAVLFVGRSGAGKSTAATIASRAGATFLADDMIFVQIGNDVSPRVHCLPFRQKNEGILRPYAVPVAAVYAITQAARDVVRPLDATESLRKTMIATTLSVRHPHFAKASFELAGQLARSVPVRLLEFRDTPAFWNVVLDDLESLTV